MVLLELVGEKFPSASNLKDSIVVNLNWGIKRLDREGVGAWDSNNIGKLQWDDSFTVAPQENQKALLDLCKDLQYSSDLVKNNRVTCWIQDMENFVKTNTASSGHCSGGKLMPLASEADFDKCLLAFFQTEKG